MPSPLVELAMNRLATGKSLSPKEELELLRLFLASLRSLRADLKEARRMSFMASR